MLVITHIRDIFKEKSTLGEVYINNALFCYTLEDAARPPSIKVAGKTCIPAGKYMVSSNMSQRFGRQMLLIHNDGASVVRDGIRFNGIRTHGGNTEEDTAGCILVARTRNAKAGRIYGSSEQDLLDIVLSNGDSVIWCICHAS